MTQKSNFTYLLVFVYRTAAFEPDDDTITKPPPRSLSPIKHEPSTSTKTSTASQATKSSAAPQAGKSAPASKSKTARASSPVPKPKGKSSPFLTRAFFNTVAPGLASFAETQKSDLDVVVEEEDEIEEDPDVIAIVADF